MKDKCFIDTNILVYANDCSDKKKQNKAKTLIFDLIKNDNGVISAQVLNEFFYTVTKKIENPISIEDAKSEIEHFICFEIVELDENITLKAINIMKKTKISFWDSLIISAALTADCRILYSEDLSHNQKIDDIQIVNIFL